MAPKKFYTKQCRLTAPGAHRCSLKQKYNTKKFAQKSNPQTLKTKVKTQANTVPTHTTMGKNPCHTILQQYFQTPTHTSTHTIDIVVISHLGGLASGNPQGHKQSDS